MLRRVKYRAAKRHLNFNLTLAHLESLKVDVCPVLGIKLQYGGGSLSDNSASVDRRDNTKGYIVGNVFIISHRANVIKNFGTVDEHRRVIKYMQGDGQ
jgi:hypothetical protein